MLSLLACCSEAQASKRPMGPGLRRNDERKLT